MPDFAQHSACQGFWDMGDHRDVGNNCGFEFLVWISCGGFCCPTCSVKQNLMWCAWAVMADTVRSDKWSDLAQKASWLCCLMFGLPEPHVGTDPWFQTRCMAPTRKTHLLDLEFRWDRHPDIYFACCASWSSCHLTPPHTPQISPVPHEDSEFANPDISWLSISFSFHPTFSLPSYGCHHVRIQRLDNRKLLAALWRFRFFGYVPGRSGFGWFATSFLGHVSQTECWFRQMFRVEFRQELNELRQAALFSHFWLQTWRFALSKKDTVSSWRFSTGALN